MITDDIPSGLDSDDVSSFREHGFVVIPSLLTSTEIADTDAAIDEVVGRALTSSDYSQVMEIEPESPQGRPTPRRIYHPFEQHPVFRSIGTARRLLDCIESLIGPSFGLHHSKLNMKPARVGSAVEWHQDLAYFPHTNDDLVTTLIYLDEATPENGCLQVLPGMRHRYLSHERPDGTFAGMITEPIDRPEMPSPLPLPAPAGSVIFMHACLPHSSLPNRSDRPRRTLIYEYRAADAFPIYYGAKLVHDEAHTLHLRGNRSRTARFGGPPPLIPAMPENARSLYELQAETVAHALAARR